MLSVTGPNQRWGRCRLNASTARLHTAPERLRKNPGARKLPNSRLPATTRSSDTHAATRQPKRSSTMSVTMLASPGFTPGSGEGMAFSSTVRPRATAAILAMWWSSGVVSSLIVEAVIFFCAPGQFDADLVRQTYGDLAGLLQPALAHAILPGAGVGADARTALLDGDDTGAQRAGHFDLLVARQRHFLEHLA